MGRRHTPRRRRVSLGGRPAPEQPQKGAIASLTPSGLNPYNHERDLHLDCVQVFAIPHDVIAALAGRYCVVR